jgi:tetratricopeptide (TPR) repeat protein
MGRRRTILIVLLVAVGGGGGLGWYVWRRSTAPVPPEIVTEGLDREWAEAIEKARQKIYADPYSAQAWGDLGKVLRAGQFLVEAAACFAQAERLEPNNPRWPYLQGEALRLRDNSAALAPLERAAALAGNADTVAPSLRLAEVLLALGRNEEAETHLRRALEIEPDDPAVHYDLGIVTFARNDWADSLVHLKHCEHSPFTRRRACSLLATVYGRMDRKEEAEKYSHKADTLPPDSNWLDPFLADARTLGRSARWQEIHQRESRGDYRTAVEQLTALLQDSPDYSVYVALGKNLGKLGNFAGAEEALRSAIAMAPERFNAYQELSQLLWMRAERDDRKNRERARGEFEEAASYARRAIERQPHSAMAYVLLGMSLRRLGKRPEALDAFRTAVECSPDLAEAHLYLGETLAEGAQTAEARESIQRAVELAPDDSRPRAALAKLNATSPPRP